MGVYIFGTGGSGGNNIDLSNDTVAPAYVLAPFTFHDKDGVQRTGAILNWDGTVLSGASSDPSKIVVSPSADATRHIPAGSYLGREVEITPFPQGSAVLSRQGNVVTLTKTAGSISGGTVTETIPAYTGATSITPGSTAKTFDVQGKYCGNNLTVNGDGNLTAGNIKSGTSIFGVIGTYSGTTYPTYTGTTGITPGKSNQSFATAGKLVSTNLTVYGDSNLTAANIRSGASIFGVSGSYTVTPRYSGGSFTANSTSFTISPGFQPLMIAFTGPETTTNNKVVAGMAYANSTTGRGVVKLNSSAASGDIFNVSWSSNSVTVSISSSQGYTFTTGSNQYRYFLVGI